MKIWSVGTALRNPLRIPNFLRVLSNFMGTAWDTDCQLDYYIELIRMGEVEPNKIRASQLPVSQQQARTLMYNNYEDAPIRGRVLGSLFEKLGFVDIRHGIINLTARGSNLLNGVITLNDALIDGLTDWQYIHTQSQWQYPLAVTLPTSRSYSPFVATLYLIGRVNIINGLNTGISYREFNYFAKTLDNYSLVDTFANSIISIRANQNNAANFMTFVNDNFTNIQNASDYIDNDIKYFVESTLIESNYVGNGMNCNFANLNYNYISQIRSIINANISNSQPI